MASPTTPSSGYWYAADGGTAGADDAAPVTSIDVLNALRRYRSAEAAMRRRTRDSMGMGETDMLALRLLLDAERRGTTLGPKDLAQRLAISSASVTVLIDRLVKSGHVERRPHPTDRRAIVVAPTAATDDEVRSTLDAMHHRMLAVADRLSPDDARVVRGFLDGMRDAVEPSDGAH